MMSGCLLKGQWSWPLNVAKFSKTPFPFFPFVLNFCTEQKHHVKAWFTQCLEFLNHTTDQFYMRNEEFK